MGHPDVTSAAVKLQWPPKRPAIHAAPPLRVPVFPWPVESAATVPVPSSNFHQAVRAELVLGSHAATAVAAPPSDTARMIRRLACLTMRALPSQEHSMTFPGIHTGHWASPAQVQPQDGVVQPGPTSCRGRDNRFVVTVKRCVQTQKDGPHLLPATQLIAKMTLNWYRAKNLSLFYDISPAKLKENMGPPANSNPGGHSDRPRRRALRRGHVSAVPARSGSANDRQPDVVQPEKLGPPAGHIAEFDADLPADGLGLLTTANRSVYGCMPSVKGTTSTAAGARTPAWS